VYEELLDVSRGLTDVCISPYRGSFAGERPTPLLGPYFTRPDDKLIKHFLLPAFAGNDFAAEIHHTFYQKFRLVVKHHYDLESTLRNGLFVRNPSSRPGDSIRRLEVWLSFKNHNFSSSYGEHEDRERGRFQYDFHDEVQDLREISSIKQLNGFELCISVRCVLAETALKYREALVPFMYDLKEKGAIVAVTRPVGYDGGPDDYDYDIPRAEWDERIHTSSVFVSLCPCRVYNKDEQMLTMLGRYHLENVYFSDAEGCRSS
jgi:hypothetical protein